jgi:hypothetical protein
VAFSDMLAGWQRDSRLLCLWVIAIPFIFERRIHKSMYHVIISRFVLSSVY